MTEEKPEVLDAVLKETVDLVMDLIIGFQDFLDCGFFIFCFELFVDAFCSCAVFVCRRTFPLRKCLRI